MPPTTRLEPRAAGAQAASATSVAVATPAAVGSPAWIAERITATGCRVVGIAGAGTTVGLGALATQVGEALAAHGQRVAHRSGPVLLHPGDATTDAADVVLVVGGDWFPAGPIHSRRLIGQVCGCGAAVLVRPADRPPRSAHGVALESLGVQLVATVDATALVPHGAGA